MKKYITAFLLGGALLTACDAGDQLTKKKKKLEELKASAKELRTEIKELENEIAAQDSSFVKSDEGTITLVSVIPVTKKEFEHKTEIRGSVRSRRNVVISAETGGRITGINVKEGDVVKKGASLATLDAQTIRTSIDEVQKQMELAKALYERQANLWKDSIGSEIQYLQAKNNYESLQKRLKSLNTQLSYAYVKAPFGGSVEEVFAKEGEMAAPGTPLMRIVSLEEMYIYAEASEAMVGKFQRGQQVEVTFPSISYSTDSKIKAIGQVIDEGNRTFSLEIALPDMEAVKPNMTAVINLRDYAANNALVLPTQIIQRDAKGHFVFITDKDNEGMVARKKHVVMGRTYEGESEITGGLEGSERVISNGYREVTDGVSIRITDKVADNKMVSTNGK